MKKNSKILQTSVIALLSLFMISGCSSIKSMTKRGVKTAIRQNIKKDSHKGLTKSNSGSSSENKNGDYKDLANLDYNPGSNPVITVNNNKANLKASDWKTEKIIYDDLDNLNRTQSATAYLSKENLGKSEGRDPQVFNPTGWHNQAKKVNGKRVFPQNRGHLLAYTLTFNFTDDGQFRDGEDGSLDNPKNLATQSAYSNQILMQQESENIVREALTQNKKVIYKVTTVFRGDELMPRGYWVQALSTDGSVQFNKYIFNVQPGLEFNYADGTSKVNSSMTIPE